MPGGLAEQLGAKTFAEIGIKMTDGHTARVLCQRRRLTVTYIDLGLATRMRTPTLQWDLLVAVCVGHGVFRWKKYGTFANARQNVYLLRNKLKAAFGLQEDPFHAYRVVDGWRSKFFASSEVGADEP